MTFYARLGQALVPTVEETDVLNAQKDIVDSTDQVSYLEVKDLLKTIIELRSQNQRLTNAMNIVLEEMTVRDV